MQITLKCKYSSGSVGFAAQRIEGLPVEARKYEIENNLVTIAGEDAIVHHDVDELLASGIYQMLTPAEQEKQKINDRLVSQLQESASSSEESEQKSPDAPPAVDKKKAG